MQPDIIAIGEPLLEFNATGEGQLSENQHFSVGWGGDTSNFIIAASRQGSKTGYITRIGNDPFGEFFLSLWKKENVDISHVDIALDSFTGIYFISRKKGHHEFHYLRKNSAAAQMTPGFLPMDYIRQAKILHVSGISQAISTSACDTIFEAINNAKQAGVKISYDSNLRLKLWSKDRAESIINKTVGQADLFFPSLDDSILLTGLQKPEDIVQYYLGLGAKIVVLKMGSKGALLATRDQMDLFPPFKVEMLDASGAGDAFDGAFVNAFLQQHSLSECVEIANAAGALTTTGLGAVNPIPDMNAVKALLKNKRSASGSGGGLL